MKKIIKLPENVKIRILHTETGKYVAELIDYNVFTEADSLCELDFLINDLICVYFDVPKKMRKNIKYVLPEFKPNLLTSSSSCTNYQKYLLGKMIDGKIIWN